MSDDNDTFCAEQPSYYNYRRQRNLYLPSLVHPLQIQAMFVPADIDLLYTVCTCTSQEVQLSFHLVWLSY